MRPTLRLKLKIGVTLAFLSLCVASVLTYTLLQARDQKEAEVAANVKNYASVLDQSISSAARKIDLSLLGIADQLQEQIRLNKKLNADAVNHLLALRKQWHGDEVEFRVTDSQGAVRYGPGVDLTKLASYADRPFFAHLRQTDDPQVVVSQPVLGKVSKVWVIVYARRYNDAQGKFAGVIAAAVPLSTLTSLLSALDLGPSGVALLRDAQGGLLVRYPATNDPSGEIGAKIYSKELANIMASGRTAVEFHTKNAGDRSERVVSYRRLANTPFQLIVGMGPSDYLADWRKQAANVTAVGCAFLLITMFFAWGLWRAFDASELARAESERSVAERDAALENLKNQSRLLGEVVESLPYGLVVYDNHREKQLANTKFGEILKIPSELHDRAGFRFQEFLQFCEARGDFTDGEPVEQRYARLTAAMDERRMVSGERKQWDGAYIEFRALPISDGWTAITYLDNTERRLQQERLNAIQARAQLATESAGIGIWELRLLTGELLWDAQQYRLHGMQPGSGSKDFEMWRAVLHPHDIAQAQAKFQSALDQREDFVAEFRVVWNDASVHHIRALGRLSYDEAGNPTSMVGTNRDITDAVLTANSLIEARDKAEQASVSKSLFLANMSHEIRTPMNAILGLLQLLSSTPLKPSQIDYVGKISSSAKSLLGLLNDILDFSKIEADKLDLMEEPFEVDRLLHDVGVVLGAYVGVKPVDLIFDLDARLPATLVGDALRLRQVLVNLAGNAIKFTEKGHVRIGVQMLDASLNEGACATLQFDIEDTGIGIAPENLPRLFNSFTQAEGSTTRRFGGTGLGLAICKKLVELMGGTIGVTSQAGVGSKFTFQIAMALGADAGAAPFADSSKPQPQTVLLLDDNVLAREAALNMMHAIGWQVNAVASTDEALRLLQSAACAETVFDAVFIDCQLQPLDGWHALRSISNCQTNAIGPATRFVMLGVNGRDRLDQRTVMEQALVDQLIARPFTASTLLGALEQADTQVRLGNSQTDIRALEGVRILVVEDNAINQQVAEELLTRQGAIVAIAADGRLGVNAIASAKEQYDIVLMDIQMPVMDGYEATHIIRHKLGLDKLPIVGLTANAMATDRERCLQAGMNDHLGKPFELAQLVQVIRKLVGSAPKAIDTAPSAVVADPLVAQAEGDSLQMDVDEALARLGGLVPVYRRAASGLAGQLPDLLPGLTAAVAAADPNKAIALLHTFKGTAATLGLKAFSKQLAGWEKRMTASQDLAELEAELPHLKDDVAQALAQLQRALAELPFDDIDAPRNEGEKVAGLARAAGVLHQMLVYLLDQDYAAITYFSENRMTLANLPHDDEQRLEMAIQELDFDAAIAACKAAQSKINLSINL